MIARRTHSPRRCISNDDDLLRMRELVSQQELPLLHSPKRRTLRLDSTSSSFARRSSSNLQKENDDACLHAITKSPVKKERKLSRRHSSKRVLHEEKQTPNDNSSASSPRPSLLQRMGSFRRSSSRRLLEESSSSLSFNNSYSNNNNNNSGSLLHLGKDEHAPEPRDELLLLDSSLSIGSSHSSLPSSPHSKTSRKNKTRSSHKNHSEQEQQQLQQQQQQAKLVVSIQMYLDRAMARSSDPQCPILTLHISVKKVERLLQKVQTSSSSTPEDAAMSSSLSRGWSERHLRTDDRDDERAALRCQLDQLAQQYADLLATPDAFGQETTEPQPNQTTRTDK